MENSELISLAAREGYTLNLRQLEPNDSAIATYVQTGRSGYRDHYCHLWPKGDPWPYIDRNFTTPIVSSEVGREGLSHWLVYWNNEAGGICKVDSGKAYPGFLNRQSLYLEKLYFRKACTGKGIGGSMLEFLRDFALKAGKTGIWLEAMQKGPALNFYLKNGFEIIGETQVPYPEVVPEERHMWVLGLAF
ncbi:Acetyltransferase (GNAT) family protein [Robiginitalea myxolifaciens]|uniref:Acetyltransferase (GNAT) family protein n=1 Tax=Robiginitalea myxolifaciens TaxID=400055 RepID=A0A1I6H9G0_9FLAO|nr:GNAT family N-acetyltransferase [Robiginitalea myxolifaciens]SFR50941.1 Acetyltransferase (GNAT) family protein [Robiginitalea myxolifaciens]